MTPDSQLLIQEGALGLLVNQNALGLQFLLSKG